VTTADLGTTRKALRDRLARLDSTVAVFETARETVRAPRVIIIYPRPWRWMNVGCNVEYQFYLEVWISTDMGLDRAQDVLDAYLSPMGTNTLSIEAKCEDRTIADDLTTYTASVVVGAFETYSLGQLNETDGWLVGTVTVTCYSTS
jgi:hypothetical protein